MPNYKRHAHLLGEVLRYIAEDSRHPCYDLQKSLLRRRSMSITQLHDLSTPLGLLVTDSLRLLHFINLGGLYTYFHRNGNGGLKK